VEEEFEDTKRGNQNSYIEEEQTTQWLKEKVQKDNQRTYPWSFVTLIFHNGHVMVATA
jgi:hypothetical protein